MAGIEERRDKAAQEYVNSLIGGPIKDSASVLDSIVLAFKVGYMQGVAQTQRDYSSYYGQIGGGI